MVFKRNIKADHSTPGFKWRPTDDGGLEGRLYVTWPLRIKKRFVPALVLSLVLGFIGILSVSPNHPDLLGILARGAFNAFLWLYPIMLIWPFWPMSTLIRLDADYLTIGNARYDLSEVSSFSSVRCSFMRGKYDEQLQFHYGRKTIKIKVPNPPTHTLRIAEFLNWARGGLLERGTLVSDEMMETEEDSGRATAF